MLRSTHSFPRILHDKDIQKPRGPRLVWKVPSMCQPVRLGDADSPGKLWSLTSKNMVPGTESLHNNGKIHPCY